LVTRVEGGTGVAEVVAGIDIEDVDVKSDMDKINAEIKEWMLQWSVNGKARLPFHWGMSVEEVIDILDSGKKAIEAVKPGELGKAAGERNEDGDNGQSTMGVDSEASGPPEFLRAAQEAGMMGWDIPSYMMWPSIAATKSKIEPLALIEHLSKAVRGATATSSTFLCAGHIPVAKENNSVNNRKRPRL
jgi:hypothetical protein